MANSRKRKAPASTSGSAAKKRSRVVQDAASKSVPYPNDSESHNEQPFRLLDIPGELRDSIYEKVLENHPAVRLSRNSSQKTLAVGSSLARVSRQIRSEFLSFAAIAAPSIKTTVRNYNFSHVIAFLNRCSDLELKRMESKKSAGTESSFEAPDRIIQIQLFFTNDWYRQTLNQGVGRWLNRVETEKKGAKIQFQYTCEPKRSRGIHPIFGTWGSRRYEEAEKISSAMAKAQQIDWYGEEDSDL